MIRINRLFVVMLVVVAVLLMAAPIVHAQGEEDDSTETVEPAQKLADMLTDPETLATIVLLVFAQVFDLFERFLVAVGGDVLIDNASKKRVVSYALSGVLAVGVFYVTSLLFPDSITFTFDGAFALASAVAGIVLGQVSFVVHRAAGMLISSRAAG